MKVKAIKLGFIGSRIKPGTIFELKDKIVKKKGVDLIITAEQQFSSTWMEKIEEAPEVHVFEPEVPAVDEVKEEEPKTKKKKKTKKKSIKKEDKEGEE